MTDIRINMVKAYVQAGGGWVNDSEPEAELKAVALAEAFARTP